ncbi:hypothetical protein L218DRAFT_859484 [Marasmius fiardii PR-910]|nr:hypothetical protein L218DRAFT_859484 [Marasmius fiardii PR-910]
MNTSGTWLAQASSVFHAHGISLDEGLSNYKFIGFFMKLSGTLQNSNIKHQRRRSCPPIYMFLLPVPSFFQKESSSTALLHIWSFHENGESPLSYDMCKYLGLPFKLSLNMYSIETCWPTRTYETIHEYQVANGFDPRTTDFVEYLNLGIFEIVLPQDACLEEVDDGMTFHLSFKFQFSIFG